MCIRDRDIAVIAQDQLKQVGIAVTIETLEWGEFLDGTARGDQMCIRDRCRSIRMGYTGT